MAMNEGTVMKAQEIASLENIPKKFLEHILNDLRAQAFIGSKKGAEGGYYLIKPAKSILLSDIYRLFDGAIALLPCASDKYYEPCDDCLDPETCKMKSVFIEVRNKTYKLLSKKTILSMVE
jgi:Rrf2 family protein